MRLTPDHVEETVSVSKLPNYQERFDITAVKYDTMKRHNDTICCRPVFKPVHYKDTMIFFHNNCTKKRFVSHTYYEPRLKPRMYSETLVIYPKQPQTVYVTGIDHHIDECRKWFKTSLEFTAKTFTTNRIKKKANHSSTCNMNGVDKTDSPVRNDGLPAPRPTSSVLFPRFDNTSHDVNERSVNMQILTNADILTNGYIQNGDILENGSSLSGTGSYQNGDFIHDNGDLVNGDIHISGGDSQQWGYD